MLLCHLLSHLDRSRVTRRRGNAHRTRTFERVDEGGLAHVRIADDADGDRRLHAVVATVVLQQLQHAVRAQTHVAGDHAAVRLPNVHVVATQVRPLRLRTRLEQDRRVLLTEQTQPLRVR